MSNDPLDSAMDAEYNPKRNFFGAVSVDVYYCVLVKGMGKVPFDPNQHNQDQRRTSITLTIDPLPDSKSIYPIERDMIAESKEWANIVKPSLKALNTDLRAINGKWAQVELVPTGQKYRDKNGEEKERTALRFLAVYNTETECQAASAALFGSKQGETSSHAAPAATPAATNGAERDTAKKFLPALWKSSGQDVTRFAELIASNGLVSKHFSINSPEVLELIQAA